MSGFAILSSFWILIMLNCYLEHHQFTVACGQDDDGGHFCANDCVVSCGNSESNNVGDIV